MGKNQIPRGVRKKSKCPKCGRYYYQLSEKSTKACSVCLPDLYRTQKEKEQAKKYTPQKTN